MAAPRLGSGLYALERALGRVGFAPVAGADEAGRGACAGPLVAAAVVLPQGREGVIEGLKDSKLLTARARERLYPVIMERAEAVAWVRIEAGECDRLGMHVADLQAMRRAVSRLEVRPNFVLTDGFGVDGLEAPGLGVWKGDRVAACVAAASIVAKVTRDAIMAGYGQRYAEFNFAGHKGYCTAAHQRELEAHGPCDIHRLSFDNVARTVRVKTP